MITIRDLSKKFDGRPALSGMNLTIQDGSIYGLVGTNGAGKTTVIKHMAGVLKPDSGEILFDGQPVWENIAVKERIGLVPDELYFPNRYSLADMKKIYRDTYPLWNDTRFDDMTGIFKLEQKRLIRTFSKGMTKQAAFSLVLSAMPDYLLLDEPIDGLDPIVRKIVWRYIVNDVAERGTSVLVSSHNLKEMEDICDSVGIIAGGKTILERDLDSIKESICKVQLAFPRGANKAADTTGLDVIHKERHGTVELLIIKNDFETVEKALLPQGPVLFDILPLSLEEVFIYELGGEDNEIRKLIF